MDRANLALGSSSISLHDVFKALTRLNLLSGKIEAFWQTFYRTIVEPRLALHITERTMVVSVDSDILRVGEQTSDNSFRALLYDMQQIIDYLRSRLPSIAVEPLAQLMMPRVTSILTDSWLIELLPLDLEGMPSFQANVALVHEFIHRLDTWGWPGGRELMEWTNKLPAIWLKKRRESSLEQMRQLLAGGLGSSKKVERTETQVVSQGNNISAEGGTHSDWNSEWSDSENKSSNRVETQVPSRMQDPRDANVEEEDVSAWGLDDDGSSPSVPRTSEGVALASDVEDGEAWGWADDAEKELPESPIAPAKPRQINGRPEPEAEERNITLTETYNITSLPDQIIEIIIRAISDASTLNKPG